MRIEEISERQLYKGYSGAMGSVAIILVASLVWKPSIPTAIGLGVIIGIWMGFSITFFLGGNRK